MDERVAKNSDDLFRMMEEDDLEDQAEAVRRMTIGDYARLRHCTPQNVHYYIRNRRLRKHKCDCGRFVIDIEEADEVMGFKKKEPYPQEAEDEPLEG